VKVNLKIENIAKLTTCIIMFMLSYLFVNQFNLIGTSEGNSLIQKVSKSESYSLLTSIFIEEEVNEDDDEIFFQHLNTKLNYILKNICLLEITDYTVNTYTRPLYLLFHSLKIDC